MKINPILNYFDKFSDDRQATDEKGNFVECLLYDYFESFGYNVSLCKTINGKQWFGDCIIPDLLVESFPNYLFFIESKSAWTYSGKGIFVPIGHLKSYRRFYDVYPIKHKSNIKEFETKIIFTKFESIPNGGRFNHYICDMKDSSNLSKQVGDKMFWDFSDLERNCETIRQDVYHSFSWDGNVFTSNYCSDILAKNRYVWTFDEKQMKLLSEGKLSNNEDGW